MLLKAGVIPYNFAGYGVNPGDNPDQNTGFRVKPGMTNKGKGFLIRYTNRNEFTFSEGKSQREKCLGRLGFIHAETFKRGSLILSKGGISSIFLA